MSHEFVKNSIRHTASALVERHPYGTLLLVFALAVLMVGALAVGP